LRFQREVFEEGKMGVPAGRDLAQPLSLKKKWWRAALATPRKRGVRNQEALGRANGTSWEIDCEVIGG
jgi:hypothetical protein